MKFQNKMHENRKKFEVCWWKKLHAKNVTIETIINRVNIVHVKKETTIL